MSPYTPLLYTNSPTGVKSMSKIAANEYPIARGESRGAWSGGYRKLVPAPAHKRMDVRIPGWSGYLFLPPFKLSVNSKSHCNLQSQIPSAPGLLAQHPHLPSDWQPTETVQFPPSAGPVAQLRAAPRSLTYQVPGSPNPDTSFRDQASPATSRPGKPVYGLKRTK
jgi:hypothetical protein